MAIAQPLCWPPLGRDNGPFFRRDQHPERFRALAPVPLTVAYDPAERLVVLWLGPLGGLALEAEHARELANDLLTVLAGAEEAGG